MYSYKNYKFWNPTKLWKLRQQIVLGSYFISDYINSYNIPAKIVCGFFDGYLENLWGEYDDDCLNHDNKENLWKWFYGIEYPFGE